MVSFFRLESAPFLIRIFRNKLLPPHYVADPVLEWGSVDDGAVKIAEIYYVYLLGLVYEFLRKPVGGSSSVQSEDTKLVTSPH